MFHLCSSRWRSAGEGAPRRRFDNGVIRDANPLDRLAEREHSNARGSTLLSAPLASALKELTSDRPADFRLTQKRLRELSRVTKASYRPPPYGVPVVDGYPVVLLRPAMNAVPAASMAMPRALVRTGAVPAAPPRNVE